MDFEERNKNQQIEQKKLVLVNEKPVLVTTATQQTGEVFKFQNVFKILLIFLIFLGFIVVLYFFVNKKSVQKEVVNTTEIEQKLSEKKVRVIPSTKIEPPYVPWSFPDYDSNSLVLLKDLPTQLNVDFIPQKLEVFSYQLKYTDDKEGYLLKFNTELSDSGISQSLLTAKLGLELKQGLEKQGWLLVSGKRDNVSSESHFRLNENELFAKINVKTENIQKIEYEFYYK